MTNRFWLINGIKTIHKTKSIGLNELINVCGLKGRTINGEDIGFQLAPRINAAGRLGKTNLILDLLTTKNKESAIELASEINELNKKRRILCKTIEEEAINILEKDSKNLPSFILLAQNHWHQGIIGIVASKIKDK